MKNPMNKRAALAGFCAGAMMIFAVWVAGQALKTSEIVLPQDKGPDKINVSSYPANIQADYKVFTEHCGTCHTLARGLNTSMPAVYWANYIGRMAQRPEVGITPEQADQIYQFLAYDQLARKSKYTHGLYPAHTEDELQKLKQQQGK